ncbi:RNA polymerase subunit AC19, partial [Cladochytrium tenue]
AIDYTCVDDTYLPGKVKDLLTTGKLYLLDSSSGVDLASFIRNGNRDNFSGWWECVHIGYNDRLIGHRDIGCVTFDHVVSACGCNCWRVAVLLAIWLKSRRTKLGPSPGGSERHGLPGQSPGASVMSAAVEPPPPAASYTPRQTQGAPFQRYGDEASGSGAGTPVGAEFGPKTTGGAAAAGAASGPEVVKFVLPTAKDPKNAAAWPAGGTLFGGQVGTSEEGDVKDVGMGGASQLWRAPTLPQYHELDGPRPPPAWEATVKQTGGNPVAERGKSKLKGEIDDPYSATFVIRDEDHTLGNSLRYILMKNPQVSFCGYSLPHPSEFKIHIRIQTNGEITAADALDLALDQLVEVCEHVKATFLDKLNESNYTVEADADLDRQIALIEPPPKL